MKETYLEHYEQIQEQIIKELQYAELKHPRQTKQTMQEWVNIAIAKLNTINQYNSCGVKGCMDCAGRFHAEEGGKIITTVADTENQRACKMLATIAILIRGLNNLGGINTDCRDKIMEAK